MKAIKRILLVISGLILLLALVIVGLRLYNDHLYQEAEALETPAYLLDPGNISLYPTTAEGITITHLDSGQLQGFHLLPDKILHKGIILVYGGSEGSPNISQAMKLAGDGYEVLSLFMFSRNNQLATLNRVPLDGFADVLSYVENNAADLLIAGSEDKMWNSPKMGEVIQLLKDTPGGDVPFVDFTLCGKEFQAISAGPYFVLNSTISLMVKCGKVEEVNSIWVALLEGGEVLMPLEEYPFSQRYGWLKDRFGLSWQIILAEEEGTSIAPCLLFSGPMNGKAEEALNHYVQTFDNAKEIVLSKYERDAAPASEAKVNYGEARLEDLTLVVMDNAMTVSLAFNEAGSIIIRCKNQQEMDYLYTRISAVPEAEQCGWVKDQFGMSWQIVPDFLDEAMFRGSDQEVQKLNQAILPMKRLDYDALLELTRK